MKILVTGAAGFIGSNVATRLLSRGDEVTGLDSINDYYDVNVKYGRLERAGITRNSIEPGKKAQSSRYPGYSFIKMNLEDRKGVEGIFRQKNLIWYAPCAQQGSGIL
jgi:UDP-glucuronate 4-epimerase